MIIMNMHFSVIQLVTWNDSQDGNIKVHRCLVIWDTFGALEQRIKKKEP